MLLQEIEQSQLDQIHNLVRQLNLEIEHFTESGEVAKVGILLVKLNAIVEVMRILGLEKYC